MNGPRKTLAHKIFSVLKPLIPGGLERMVRGWGTAIIQPIYMTGESGFFLSSILSRAVDKNGNPVPWYTYPAIHFLSSRDFTEKTILEFGAGQSTLWWASRAKKVTAFEDNENWYRSLCNKKPNNVDLFHLPLTTREDFTVQVDLTLKETSALGFDVIVIDGGFREEAVALAIGYLNPSGALIVDDAEVYGMWEVLRDKGLKRIDFYGPQPGVLLPHVTALFYKEDCFLLDAKQNMPKDLN